jgi:hypothetical protein
MLTNSVRQFARDIVVAEMKQSAAERKLEELKQSNILITRQFANTFAIELAGQLNELPYIRTSVGHAWDENSIEVKLYNECDREDLDQADTVGEFAITCAPHARRFEDNRIYVDPKHTNVPVIEMEVDEEVDIRELVQNLDTYYPSFVEAIAKAIAEAAMETDAPETVAVALEAR